MYAAALATQPPAPSALLGDPSSFGLMTAISTASPLPLCPNVAGPAPSVSPHPFPPSAGSHFPPHNLAISLRSCASPVVRHLPPARTPVGGRREATYAFAATAVAVPHRRRRRLPPPPTVCRSRGWPGPASTEDRGRLRSRAPRVCRTGIDDGYARVARRPMPVAIGAAANPA